MNHPLTGTFAQPADRFFGYGMASVASTVDQRGDAGVPVRLSITRPSAEIVRGVMRH